MVAKAWCLGGKIVNLLVYKLLHCSVEGNLRLKVNVKDLENARRKSLNCTYTYTVLPRLNSEVE